MTDSKAWEFWPPWMFYAPVSLCVAALAARYGFRALPAANPGLPDGGLVGESKAEILRKLPAEWTIPFILLPPGRSADDARRRVDASGWAYPLIAKPDVGQRGVGVKRLHTDRDLIEYLNRHPKAVLIQPWHPGPYEAGIFYVRHPREARGRIFSLTDKHFPFVIGDGQSTLAQLIRRHPRFRRQAALFLRRHAAEQSRVLAAGERRTLSDVGNHAQGTMFVDGAHLITPALSARVDAIAQAIPGFFVGRFDVRYTDPEAFKAGRDLAIVELNGVTAESTNIYDPSRTLAAAYRTLFTQWTLIFQIGAANLLAGADPPPLRRLAALVWAFLSDPTIE
jgi:hypothetical protein